MFRCCYIELLGEYLSAAGGQAKDEGPWMGILRSCLPATLAWPGGAAYSESPLSAHINAGHRPAAQDVLNNPQYLAGARACGDQSGSPASR